MAHVMDVLHACIFQDVVDFSRQVVHTHLVPAVHKYKLGRIRHYLLR
jgi:hypothetical protein